MESSFASGTLAVDRQHWIKILCKDTGNSGNAVLSTRRRRRPGFLFSNVSPASREIQLVHISQRIWEIDGSPTDASDGGERYQKERREGKGLESKNEFRLSMLNTSFISPSPQEPSSKTGLNRPFESIISASWPLVRFPARQGYRSPSQVPTTC